MPLGRCRSVTAVATLFTFWPPGPLDRAKVSSRSATRMPRRCIRSASASFDMALAQLLRLNFRDVFSSVAKNASHPDQFVQEFVEASHITLIEQISPFIEKLFHVPEIHVPKNCYQAQLAHDRQQPLDYSRTAKWSRRDTANADCLVNVLLQIHIERVLEKAGITMIVFGRYYNEPIATFDSR